MISGRSLGHTGWHHRQDGVDSRLQRQPDSRADARRTSCRTVGGFIAGQTEAMVPADRVLYAAGRRPHQSGANRTRLRHESDIVFITEMERPLARCHRQTPSRGGRKLCSGAEWRRRGLGRPARSWWREAAGLKVCCCLTGKVATDEGRCCGGAQLLERRLGAEGDAAHPGVSEALGRQAVRARGQFSVQEYLSRMGGSRCLVTQLSSPASGFVSDIDALSLARSASAQQAGASRWQLAGSSSTGLELLVVKGDAVKQGSPWG
uniref:Pyr_redox_2 domain-containing protein n=1 Tax=Macrostomum lignano TaxID=282301 RepID=A0A1I8F9K2_9PLAT